MNYIYKDGKTVGYEINGSVFIWLTPINFML